MDSCINWVGGKKRIAKEIVSHFPKEMTSYVEPFFGAGWVLFTKTPIRNEVINDLNQGLITFWKVIQNEEKALEFIKRLSNMPLSEQLFYEFREKTEFKDDIEKAVCFYYVLKCCYSGRAVGSGKEQFAYDVITSKHKLHNFYNTDWKKLWNRLRFVTILNKDAIDVIKIWDRPTTFFYLDPPYLVTREAELYKFQDSFLHQRLVNTLKNIKGKFLLSYDYLPEVEQMYSWANIITLELKYGLGNVRATVDNVRRKRKEYLIANYDISESTKMGKWFK